MPKITVNSSSFWHKPDRVKTCIRCHETKPISDFSAYGYLTKQQKKSTRYESRCIQCNRERRKARYSDPEKAAIDRATSAAWKDCNRVRIAEYAKARQATDEVKALKAAYQRARKARIRSNSANHDPRITDLYKQAKMLEQKLRACVACDDDLELQVHVDHITPLKLGGRHVFDNLQILSGIENLTKGAKPHFAMTGDCDA